MPLSPNPGGRTLALDIGGTKIRAAIVTECEVVEVETIGTRPEGGESVLDRVARLAARYRDVAAVGVAAAGVVNDGRVTSATDLIPGWAGADIAGRLGDELGVPVAVLGDAHAHGLAEARFGAGRGVASTLTVAVGTGIGGAYVEAGSPALGDHGVAGHLGPVLHPESVGLVCSCGRVGHLEPFASGTGIVDAYARGGDAPSGAEIGGTGEPVSGAEIARRCEVGEERAVRVITRAGSALGSAIGSIANVLDPGIIVFSGSVTAAGSAWWQSLRAGYLESAMTPVAHTPLVRGELGDHAPLLGAAAFVKENAA